jgi:SAM-dependent methyltransferase
MGSNMRDIDVRETTERYQGWFARYGTDPRSLGWMKGRQAVRFAAALDGVRPGELHSVLDVGCGFGDLRLYLESVGWKGRYHGIDLVPEFVDEARRRIPGDETTFEHIDLDDLNPQWRYSACMAIGVFNHRLRESNMEVVERAMFKMWEVCEQVLIIDFLSATADARRDDLFYADPREVYAICSRLSRRVLIHHAYMPFEFQVKIWRDDSFSTLTPVFTPYLPLVAQAGESESRAPDVGPSRT